MNFLQICQRVRQEAGISGTGPASVTNQTGEMARVVDWVKAAYEDIQNLHDNWKFMRREFTFPTIAGNPVYLPSAISLDEFGRWRRDEQWRCYLTSVNDELRMTHWDDWDCFRESRLYSVNRSTQGRPIDVAIRPNDDAIYLWPTPNNIFTITGDYYIRPHVMAANSDEPIFPREFHMLIVWRAILFYAPYEAAPERYAQANTEHKRLLAALRRKWLPEIKLGGPLA